MKVPHELSPLLEEIIEGKTRLLVPKAAMTDSVPPKKPAFFNPKAKMNRDLSMVAYAAFLKEFKGPAMMLEALAGTGARAVRTANEVGMDDVVVNDINPSALVIAECSADLNKLDNIRTSEQEACRFLVNHSKRGERGAIIDIDPFGSPAPFFDCGIRATMHGGMISVTATDLQVLNGIFQQACMRRYGGGAIRKTQFGNETAIRLMLGCLRTVTGRLGVSMVPLFVESDMHYYRAYVKVQVKTDSNEGEEQVGADGHYGDNLGRILYCMNCGHREMVHGINTIIVHSDISSNAALAAGKAKCRLCTKPASLGGPLWTGRIFDEKFVKEMLAQVGQLEVDKACSRIIERSLAESLMPGTYFTLDEIAARARVSPPRLDMAIVALQEDGFVASPTSLEPTGFRTSAKIDEVIRVFQAIR